MKSKKYKANMVFDETVIELKKVCIFHYTWDIYLVNIKMIHQTI